MFPYKMDTIGMYRWFQAPFRNCTPFVCPLTGSGKTKDTNSSAVTLFLETLYTCSAQGDPHYKTALAALDLAHRWQVEAVVAILADPLLPLGFVNFPVNPSFGELFGYTYITHTTYMCDHIFVNI